MTLDEQVDIVDESDHVVGFATRDVVHKKGMLHREVHVMFVTSLGECILQKRSASAETSANLLDATVGGHVLRGATYAETAVKETLEETGIRVVVADFTLLGTFRSSVTDTVSGTINNTFRKMYAYVFNENLAQLVPEAGKCDGFVMVPFKDIKVVSQEQSEKGSTLYTQGLLSKENIHALESAFAGMGIQIQ